MGSLTLSKSVDVKACYVAASWTYMMRMKHARNQLPEASGFCTRPPQALPFRSIPDTKSISHSAAKVVYLFDAFFPRGL